MVDDDQASYFTGEGVVNGHLRATTIAVMWHVKWFEVLLEVEVVLNLILRKKVATQPVGDGIVPNPGLACPVEVSLSCRLTLSNCTEPTQMNFSTYGLYHRL